MTEAETPGLADHPGAPASAAIGATFLWAGGNVLVRAATVAGPQLAFFRTLIGASVYNGVFIARGGRPTRSTIRTAALGGLGFGLQATLFFTALKTTTVASATVISTLQPVMMLPVSARLYGDRLSRRRLMLTFVAVAGTVLVVVGSTSEGSWSIWGDLLALAGTAMGCCYFIGTKSARATLDTLEYQAAALIVACVVALPGALLLGGGLSVPTWHQLMWPALMTAIPGTGHLLMSWAQRSLSVSFTSTVTLNVLVMTVLGAAVFFDERVSLLQGVGCSVVLVSLGLFVRDSTERMDPVAEEL